MKFLYRPEINGLRAVAVLIIIFYHANINMFGYKFFSGGFIGVDIFFVISGYLITSLILRELETTGKFNIFKFYERRARRILPALFVVMIVSLPFAWMIFLPNKLFEFAKGIISSIVFSSNYYFHYTGIEYGTESTIYKPFIHTWSLSVEEQFYIIFPIILIIVFKFFKQHLLKILIVGILVSILLADWGSRNYPSATFYFLHSRMWELLAGAVLAKLELKYKRNSYKNLNRILPTVGLILIVFSTFFYNDDTFHPSFYTLLPILGTMIIIWFSNNDEILTKILSSKIFVGCGLISYSMYLWHYPVFVFFKVLDFTQGSILNKLLIGMIIIGLSCISYIAVEKPFRNKKKISLQKFIISLLLALLVLIVFNFYVIQTKGGSAKLKDLNLYYGKNQFDNKILLKSRTLFPVPDKFIDKEKINVLFIGNSHSKDLFLAFYQNKGLFDKYEFSRLFVRMKYFDPKTKKKVPKKALKDTEKSLNSELFRQSEIVVINDVYGEKGMPALKNLINLLKQTNKKIILTSATNIYQVKNAPIRTQYDIYALEKFKKKEKIKEDDFFIINKIYFKKRNVVYKNINRKLKKIAIENNIIYLEKEEYMCDLIKQTCDGVTDDGYKIFTDSSHYSLEGAKYFGKKFLILIGSK